MLKTFAVANYRSINALVVPLERLNVIAKTARCGLCPMPAG